MKLRGALPGIPQGPAVPDPSRRMPRPWRACIALTLAVGALGYPRAAAADPVTLDSAEFPAVRVYLPEGEAPPGLLTEDGRPVAAQAVLATAARPPLVAALVVDTSGSMDPVLRQLQAAADALVQRLSAADRVALVRFSSAVEVALPLGADRAALGARIAALRADGATALYDAVWAGIEQVRSAPGPGLRAVLLITDGKDEGEGPEGTPGSALRLEPLRQRLLGAHIPVFILGLGQAVDRAVLDALAAASGGRAFYADEAGNLRGLLDTVADTLLTVQALQYISPRPAPDGSERVVVGTRTGGAAWRLTYSAPTDRAVLWRWPVWAPAARPGERRRAMCGVGALSPEGGWALAFAPLTVLHGDGSPAGSGADMPPFRAERARMLEDGSGRLFGGTASTPFSAAPGGAGQAPQGPRNWVALSPSGATALRFVPAGEGIAAKVEAVSAAGDTPLWSVACPGSGCDRLAGAAISDDGAALINQTGVLYRIAADGKVSAGRPEVFFAPVSLSADGRLGAAVVWQGPRGGGGARALLLDEALRPLETLAVQAASADVPPVAAVSANGRFAAVLDDTRLVGTVLDSVPAGRRVWRTLGRPAAPPAPCERTVQVDGLGHVLVSDGDALTLLRGLAEP